MGFRTRPGLQTSGLKDPAEVATLAVPSCLFPCCSNSRVQLCNSRSGRRPICSARLAEGFLTRTVGRSTVPAPSRALAPPPPAPWPRPLPRALWPIKKSRPGRCTPPRASVRRPRLVEESAAILFFSWFQRGEKEEAGSGAAGWGGTRRGCCHHRLCARGVGEGGVSPGREPAAAPLLREGRRREGDGGYR